jgi:hypothetical protein
LFCIAIAELGIEKHSTLLIFILFFWMQSSFFLDVASRRFRLFFIYLLAANRNSLVARSYVFVVCACARIALVLAKAITLRLHLQKHYLLKNFTSPDLEVVLDEKETYVQLTPKDDGDALRMLRASDAQVASKYRSFLTFIRCELTVVFNPIVNYERARLLAQKNMLTIEPIKRPGTAAPVGGGGGGGVAAQQHQRYLVTGTLARTKSFMSELYRLHGQDRDGADGTTLGSSNGDVATLSSPRASTGAAGTSGRAAGSAAASASSTTQGQPHAAGAAAGGGSSSPAATGAAPATGTTAPSSTTTTTSAADAAATAGNLALLAAVPLVECVVALLARTGGEQLIGTLVWAAATERFIILVRGANNECL